MMQQFGDHTQEQQDIDPDDIPDSVEQDNSYSELLEELTPEEKEQLKFEDQKLEELASNARSTGYEDGINDKPFNIGAIDILLSTDIKAIEKAVNPEDPEAITSEQASEFIQSLKESCKTAYTEGFNKGGEERRQAAEQEKSQEQNQNTKKQETDSATIELDEKTIEKVCGIFSGTYINMIIDKLNKLKKDPSFKNAHHDIKNYISQLKELKKDLTEFFKQTPDFKNYLKDIFKNKDLSAIRDIAERIQAFESIIYAIKNMVWQVRSAGETDTTKLHGIKEEIKKKYAAYLLPPKNAFGAKNFNNMKGDRDAKIAGQIVAMNQQLDKEKKAYTKNLQNKYAQVLVDSWTKEGLPEWAEADIKKLKSKSEYKDMEEKKLLQKYALKLVESNWVDDDDRNNYKNKNKQATLTGAKIVAALIRTWVIAVLLADRFKIHNDYDNREAFENLYSVKKNNFKKLQGNNPTMVNTIFMNIRETLFETGKTTIESSNAKAIKQETLDNLWRNFLSDTNELSKEEISEISLDANHIVTKTINLAANSATGILTTRKISEIYNTSTSQEYFNTTEFNTRLHDHFGTDNPKE